MRERKSIFENIDSWLFLAWLIMAIGGCFAIFSASSNGEWTHFFDLGEKHVRQFIFLGVSLLFMVIIFSLDYRFIVQSTPMIYVLSMLLLVITLFIGVEINNSKSWIRFGGVQIQPAEFSKTATSLLLAYWLSFQDRVFASIKKTILTIAIVLLPMALILLQGDMGSMLTFTVLIFILYREGLTPAPIYMGIAAVAIATFTLAFGSYYVAGAILLLIGAFLFFFRNQLRHLWQPALLVTVLSIAFSFSVTGLFNNILEDYQKDRILVTLNLKEDLHGAGYNLWQSKMAVSSGRILGKGYLQGVQTQNDFVPEVTTDYIFSNIGEEFGFLGSLFIVGMFSFMIFRILLLAERQRSTFSRVFMYCAASFFFIHVFVNVAMVIGIFPTVGIPLPFYSYGGSSLLSFSILIALVLRLDSERLYMLS